MALTLLSLFAVLAAANAGVLLDLDPRIVNGENANLGEIPYQVSLQTTSRKSHFCGGSVILANYVVTAAHCVAYQKANELQVVVGTVRWADQSNVHEVEKVIQHEKYSAWNSYLNDIALLKVKTPFKMSKYVSTATLPAQNEPVPVQSPAVVSGWGTLSVGGKIPDVLQKANLQITDQNVCKKAYRGLDMTVHDSQICASDPKATRGACNGDSGGPLVVKGKLVGIVSWSYSCALSSHPTVYTRVASHVDWINKNAV